MEPSSITLTTKLVPSGSIGTDVRSGASGPSTRRPTISSCRRDL